MFQSCKDEFLSFWFDPLLSRGQSVCSKTQHSASVESRTHDSSLCVFINEFQNDNIISFTCADQESFFRGGPTLRFFLRERESKYH